MCQLKCKCLDTLSIELDPNSIIYSKPCRYWQNYLFRNQDGFILTLPPYPSQCVFTSQCPGVSREQWGRGGRDGLYFSKLIAGVMVGSEKHLLSFHRITGHFIEKRAVFSPAPTTSKFRPHREDFQWLQKGCCKHLVAGNGGFHQCFVPPLRHNSQSFVPFFWLWNTWKIIKR